MLRAMGLRVWGAPLTAALDAPAAAVVSGAAVAPAAAVVPAAPVASAAPPLPPRAAAPRAGASRASPVPAPPAVEAAPAEPARDDGSGPDPRAARIATLDWPALRDEVAACRACALCETRRQTVFGVGADDARWMVVGEAPGEQEDRQGEPFVGPAGRLLDQMLAALDLTRDASAADPARRVYIANTLKCRPPGNRNPTPQELACCEPYLQRQIALVRPRVIVAMGRFAVQQLLRSSEAIGRLRGRVHAYQGVPLVVTYHPAYLLRNLPDKARAWQDLCLAAQTMESAGAG
ncbi:MAG: uracil-DNA glycosylase [Burkholderiales bacterium]|nr:uracil-DNA glycosylase [Burkholderiales bacterium]